VPGVPVWLSDRFTTAHALAREYERAILWEIDRPERAFWDIDLVPVLLKGAAYVAAELPPGRGRRVADVDVLVPRGRLADVEAALQAHGWQFPALDPYDERCYRTWMHELPPMVHRERRAVVDVHHALLPTTSRLRPSSERVLERAVSARAGARVLCPSHMVLHTAAHLFHDGEVAGALRDLVDLDALLRTFGEEPGFWADLVREAETLQLKRPAFYALRYADRQMPPDVLRSASQWSPSPPVLGLMDRLIEQTIRSAPGQRSGAAFALCVRSHWLRMPPHLLVRHLIRKSIRRR
jgi:Uncharacterised nucleotidyltransferase